VAASSFKANGEAIRSLGRVPRDLDGRRGPRHSVQTTSGHAAAFGIAPRSTPPQEGPTDAPDYDALANRVINRLPYRRWTRSLRPTPLGELQRPELSRGSVLSLRFRGAKSRLSARRLYGTAGFTKKRAHFAKKFPSGVWILRSLELRCDLLKIGLYFEKVATRDGGNV